MPTMVTPLLAWKKQKISRVFIAKLHITVNNKKNILCCTKMLQWRIQVARNNTTHLNVHVKYPIFCPIFKTIYIQRFSKNFRKKLLNTKFHGNPSIDIRVDICGRTEGHEANWLFWRLCQRA
jgi:hypothetical protein